MKQMQTPCSGEHAHENVEALRAQMPGDDVLYELADLYKVFGDSTRIKILYSLYAHELCVCDIAGLLGMSMSAISHQLRVLKNAKLVRARKNGRSVRYALADEHVKHILGQGMDHILE